MIYLWPQSSSMEGMDDRFGVMTTPRNGVVPKGIEEGRLWACDNGAYSGFKEEEFMSHLKKLYPYRETCLFVVAPDIVGDAIATLEIFPKWHGVIKNAGFPVAFVSQDGQEIREFPHLIDDTDWFVENAPENMLDEACEDDVVYSRLKEMFRKYAIGFEWLFIGGTTEWKMGSGAIECVKRARSIGVPVHIGRVNGWRRYEHFKGLGAQSCDGTFPTYEPDTALRRISSWFERPYNLNLFDSDSNG